ncbi:MAG TPA: phage Gp37/Gp68 family protein [Actinomycetota bacterium]|nr:phage Gp37/Gp68 family protein [Actinomycetota bacterium]
MTRIEWTEVTWNPVTGCDRVSEGCDNCYALALARRLKAMGHPRYQRDGGRRSGPGFGVTLHHDQLHQPFAWRKPRLVFVNSMSDLFHADVPEGFISHLWGVMAATPRHTYQILTKRPGRMSSIVPRLEGEIPSWLNWHRFRGRCSTVGSPWPLPNVWLGTSVENERWAHSRVPELLETPAALRFVSCEPLLGPMELRMWLPGYDDCCDECYDAGCEGDGLSCSCGCHHALGWVIVGGESGPGARPLDLDWVRDLIRQCHDAAVPVPVFVKQLGSAWARRAGARHPKGGDPNEWPEDLRVREWPRARVLSRPPVTA